MILTLRDGNMNPRWILEEFAFYEEERQIKAEIEKQGMVCEIVDRRTSMSLEETESKSKECVILYGSLDFCRKMQRNNSWWVPGNYCNLKNYECISYYPPLAQYLLNENYVMLPYGELLRRKEFLYNTLGEDDCVFIRPNSGNKTFTGKLVKKEYFEKDVDNFNFYGIESSGLCIVASPKNITHEWRFICVNKKVVTGSLYSLNGVSSLSLNSDQLAMDLAQKVAMSYEPDSVWAIDICKTKAGEYKLLEIGCFSSAGLYACDLEILIREVSANAKKEYLDIFEQ